MDSPEPAAATGRVKQALSRHRVTRDVNAAPLIEIRNAVVWRGSTRVFDGLNLTIEQHEPTAILGPNGSGKTTLLRLVTRELYPAAREDSRVRILGRETWNVWDLRAHIGVVSHDLQARYRPGTTGLEVVLSGFLSSVGVHGSLASRLSPAQRRAAVEVLEQLGIGSLRATPLGNMSTGQQRRCLLARALVHDPDTLILDEPTAGLDLEASFDYMRRIRELAADGRNIVLVTHLLNEIPPEIRRVILLRGGKVVVDGPKEAVMTTGNIRRAFGTDLRLASCDGYYFAYPPDPA
jgi:iron complex transport system ATP-binding protein